uniref:Vitellogenin domain-containing protein n=1 Tax=Graphocephala atropunctata TaxID=36148 RepID=A0A1B6KR29_9HEMI
MGWPLSLPLFLLSVVISSSSASEYGWPPQKEFLFSVQGQDLTGLPGLKPQYAGFRYNGELRVQSHTPRLLLIKFLNMNYTSIHEELPEGWWNGPESTSKNKTKILPLTTTTIVVRLTLAKSPELIIQPDLPDWQVNFIKGIVSNILTDQSQERNFGPNSNKMALSQEKDVYHVLEDSVGGRCEVVYEVVQLPKQLTPHNNRLCVDQQFWEITKTRNYSNCEVLSEDHSHLPLRDCTPGGSNCGQFWTRASVTQMIGCGKKNNFLLLSSVSSSVINAQLHLQNNSEAVLNSNLIIKLVSTSNLDQKYKPPQTVQTIKSLLYSYTAPTEDSYSRHCQGNVHESNEGALEEPHQHEPSDDIDPRMGDEGHRNKRGIKRKFGREYKTESKEDNENTILEPNTPKGYDKKSWNFKDRNQPQSEMDLEDQWKISGKEMSSSPPYQPFNLFNLAHRTSNDLSCLHPKFRQLITDIASDLEHIDTLPEKNTLDKLSLAVDICRSLPYEKLASVGQEVFEAHNNSTNNMKNNERTVFRDVVTMCGSHPALKLIKEWLERRQVDGEEAAEIISTLPSHMISPNKYYMADFYAMVEQIGDRYDRQLASTAVLALSNAVRLACVNPVARQHVFSSIVRPVCDSSITTRFTQWLQSQMNKDSDLRRVYIQALGNLGTSDTVVFLQKYALNTEFSPYLRTSAVFAMRYHVMYKEPTVVPLLLSLYHNYNLPLSIRMSAAALLFYSNPGLTVWQRLAISTWYEPSPAVAQFVASSIRTMATSQDSLYAHVTKSASLVQSLAKPVKVQPYQPYNLMASWLSNNMEKQILEQLSWMEVYDFSNLYYRHTSRFSGFSRTNIEASLSVSNPDALWSAMKEMLTPRNNLLHSTIDNMPNTLAQIKEVLGLQMRSLPNLQADLHLKINNMVERMFMVNMDTLKSLSKEGRRMVVDKLSEGKSMTYQKTDMSGFHISTTTELGFPVQFTVRTPWIVKAKADVNLTSNGLVLGAAFVYSSQMLSSVSILSAWDNVEHSAGTSATNFVQLPLFRAVLNLNPDEEALKITTTYVDQHRLLYLDMQPYTSQRKIKIHQPTLLSPDTCKVQLGQPIQIPLPWLSHYLNNIYTSEEVHHFDPSDFLGQARVVMGFPLLMPNMECRSFETVMNPLHPVIMNFSMSSTTKLGGHLALKSSRGNRTIFNEFYSGLFKSDKSDEAPNTSIDVADSTSTSTKKPEALAFFLGTREETELTPEEKEQATAREKVLLTDSSSATLGGYRVFPITFNDAIGNFNASTIDPFLNKVDGSSRSYLIERSLNAINSGRAVVVSLSLESSHPDFSNRMTAYATYSTSYSHRVSRYGLFIKGNSSEVKLTTILETPIDIATNMKRRLSEDLMRTVYVDFVYKNSGHSMYAFTKAMRKKAHEFLD